MNNLRKYARSFGVDISDKQLEQFQIYYEMLIEKNKVMNLTAITDKSEVILKHFADSIALARFYDFTRDNIRVIDIGTGAGFPGIPLKIAFPNIDITLFDSLNKRVIFLNEVIQKIGLEGVNAIHGRAEEGAKTSEHREKYDVVVSRAVANMAVLSEYCIPYVKRGGYFIPYKSGNIQDELIQAKKAIVILGGKCKRVEKLTLPDSDISRSFVFIEKTKPSPKGFPRKAGIAQRTPIM